MKSNSSFNDQSMPLIEINIDDPYIFRLARIVAEQLTGDDHISILENMYVEINKIMKITYEKSLPVSKIIMNEAIINGLINITIAILYILHTYKKDQWKHKAKTEYLYPVNIYQPIEKVLEPIIKELVYAIHYWQSPNFDLSIYHVELMLKEIFRLSSALYIDLIEEIRRCRKIKKIKQ